MAKMKIEFLSHYKARHGFTLKDRLIAQLPDYAHALSRMPWLPNLRERIPGARWAVERLLGLSAARTLPRWRGDTVWRQEQRMGGISREEALQRAASGGKVVVLFVDTFTGTFETENALAAARVLTKAGYSIHMLKRARGHYCCGRTYLSCGMVSQAKQRLRELITAAAPFARAGVALVGLEPSCLLTLRDEALVMGLGAPAQTVASQAFLFEEFVSRELRVGRCALALKATSAPVLVHGHCHQKAFAAVDPMLEVLRRIPGANPTLIQSSCCGMAGSFGYEAAHQQTSRQMAEASLLPAVRAVPDAIVVADGTSCRHQILQGTGRQALHAARLIDRQSEG
jgi:Fe-S oxidoreductase